MNTAYAIKSILHDFPDLSLFSHVEVNPVALLRDGEAVKTRGALPEEGYCYEALPPDTPEDSPEIALWTIYLRYWPRGERKEFGGVDACWDTITKGAAEHIAAELRKLLPNPSPEPFSRS